MFNYQQYGLIEELPPVPLNWGFEPIAIVQVRQPRERRGAFLRGDDGNQDIFRRFFDYGFHVQPWQPPHPPREKRPGAIMRGDDGNQDIFRRFFDYGFHIQPWQPPQFGNAIRKLFAAFTKDRDDGNQDIFRRFFDYGFHVQPWQPPRRLHERRGTFLRGDDGTQAQFIRFVDYGFHVQPWQPPAYKQGTRGTFLRGIDAIESPFQQFVDYGFHVQPWQPPHPKPERFGALVHGDEGDELVFILQLPFIEGWQIQPWQPPAFRRGTRGTFLRGIDGTDAPFIQFFDYGFHIQPWQPPHPRPERGGAIMIGVDGTDIYRQFFDYGFPIQPWQPPHPRPERGGAIMLGDIGHHDLFRQFFDYGFHIQPFQPPRWAPWRQAAGWMIGEQGVEAPFIYIPPQPGPGPQYPRLPTGKLFIIDAVDNFVFGQNPNFNESCTLLIYVGPGLPAPGNRLFFTFTKPDGTLQTGDPNFAFIGNIAITQERLNNFPAGQYVVYTFGIGELSQLGSWQVSFIADFYVSNTFTFRVS